MIYGPFISLPAKAARTSNGSFAARVELNRFVFIPAAG